MPEVVGAFLSTELGHERANCAVQTPHRPRRDLAQQGFEFAVRQLDEMRSREYFGRNCRMRFLNGSLYAGELVGSEVIDHDNVVAPERRKQELLDIGQEYLSGESSLDHPPESSVCRW